MNAHRWAALLVAAAITPVPAATADPPQAGGSSCGLVILDRSAGRDMAVLDAGPLVVADLPTVDDTVSPPSIEWDPTENPATAMVRCDVQVGSALYSAPDVRTASETGIGVVYLEPRTVEYASGTVYICTTVRVTDAHGSTATLYYDELSGDFTTEQSAARCAFVPPLPI